MAPESTKIWSANPSSGLSFHELLLKETVVWMDLPWSWRWWDEHGMALKQLPTWTRRPASGTLQRDLLRFLWKWNQQDAAHEPEGSHVC